MKKLKIGDLEKIRDKVRRTTSLRQSQSRAMITVHMGTCGIAAGARDILEAIMAEIERLKLEDVLISSSGCAGLCGREPMITVKITGEAPVKYVDLTAEKIAVICEEHIINGRIATKYALALGSERAY